MIIAVLIITGLCFGSFINALVWRVKEKDKLARKKTLSSTDKAWNERISIMQGRSMCPDCKHELAAKDLIPVFSWLSLKGKCRYCAKPISIQYPIVEALNCALFIISYIAWPVAVSGLQIPIFVLWLVFLIGLLSLAIYDLKWLILPNRIIYPLSYVALAIAILTVISKSSHLAAAGNIALAILIDSGIFYALFQVSRGKWIGGGDVRLGFLLGLVMATPGKAVLLLFLASVLGTLVSFPLIALDKLKKNSQVPFGPFLIAAAIIVELIGHFVLNWYQNAFFPNGV